MTRFTTFTGKELNNMESAFRIALDKLDGMGVDTSQQELKNLIDEVSAEKRCREKELRDKLNMVVANSNYGAHVSSCEDDEKLVVLCMINKQLKEMQNTLTLLSNALISNSKKAHEISDVPFNITDKV